jgi:hypothetical protein
MILPPLQHKNNKMADAGSASQAAMWALRM